MACHAKRRNFQMNQTGALRISPHEIAFDIDGVVTDTMGSFIRIAEERFGISGLKKEDITSYWLDECLPVPEEIIEEIISIILNDPWQAALEPLPGAIESLRALAADSPLVFVTARPVRGPIESWLRQRLDLPDDRVEVIATGRHEAKAEVLKGLGKGYFVEDHLKTCQELVRHGIMAIVLDQPWNRNGSTPFKRVRSWRELSALFAPVS
jgi:uncharacterized HAD superfamily protein